MKKTTGRPRTYSASAVQTRLSRWLDANWDKLGLTNDQAAAVFGFRAPQTISMWRTGRSAIPLARVLKIAELLAVDPIVLIILWFEQEETRDPAFPTGIGALVRKRTCTRNEQALLDAIRASSKSSNPEWGPDQIAAIVKAARK